MKLHLSPVSFRTRGNSTVFEIDVVKANPSVTEATLDLIQDKGVICLHGRLRHQPVFTYPAYQENGDFTLLVVVGLTNQVNGMAKKAGREFVKM